MRRFGNVVSGSALPGSAREVPVVVPGISLPADLSAVEIVLLSAPADPVAQESNQELGTGNAVVKTVARGDPSLPSVSSVPYYDELDVPLSKLLSLSRHPHVGEDDPPSNEEEADTTKTPTETAVVVGGQKTASPRFSSFLTVPNESFEVLPTIMGLGRG